MIRNNSHKYSVSAMCRVLNISRNICYYKSKEKSDLPILAKLIKDIFENSRKNYGTRRIKVELDKLGLRVSRRRIACIMKMKGLVSKYTIAKFKPQHNSVNEEKIDNLVERKFNDQNHLQVVVSDLTYVRVGNVWNYICVLIDLFNRGPVRKTRNNNAKDFPDHL